MISVNHNSVFNAKIFLILYISMDRGRIRDIRSLFVFLESLSVRISLAIPLPLNGQQGTDG